MNWIAIINEVFDICWLLAMLWLLFLIWRSSERRLEHIVNMESTMFEVARKDAESARESVETTRTLAAALLNEQAKSQPRKDQQ